jgi:uncharacterized protein YukE
MSPFRLITQWITPPETKPIVSELFAQAQQIRTKKNQIKKVKSELGSSWTGSARNSFISQLDSLINEYGRYARSLEEKARNVATTAVMIEIKEWFEEITPGN